MPLATFLDGQPVSQLRGLAFLSLSDQGTVLNLSGTSDSGGGGTLSWTAGSALPCRVDPLGGEEGEVGERITDRSSHLITLPPDTVIGTEDRFACSSGTFEITAVRTRTREWIHHVEAVRLD